MINYSGAMSGRNDTDAASMRYRGQRIGVPAARPASEVRTGAGVA